MQEMVISQPRTFDQVVLEGRNKYSAYITIGLYTIGTFHVRLEFINLDVQGLKSILQLFNLSKSLRVESYVIANRNFNIKHIIVNKFFAGNKFEVTWECVSEQLSFSPVSYSSLF